MNPYDILDIGKQASEAEIKAAYRSKAKVTHPDAGGDADSFDALNRAYVVLRDPGARAHYDATGEIEEGCEDARVVAALNVLAGAFDGAAMEIIQKNLDPKKTDLLAMVERRIEGDIAKRAPERAEGKRVRGFWVEIRSRLDTADGKPNRLAAFIDSKISYVDGGLERIDKHDEAARAALEILADHSYLVDPEDQLQVFCQTGFTGTWTTA